MTDAEALRQVALDLRAMVRERDALIEALAQSVSETAWLRVQIAAAMRALEPRP